MEFKQLSHLYKNGRGVTEVDLAVEAGEVFGFLGPNGAGKTTLIRTVLGLLRPTAGEGRVLGLDIARQNRELRRRVGYLPGDPALYEFLTGQQNLDFALAVRGVFFISTIEGSQGVLAAVQKMLPFHYLNPAEIIGAGHVPARDLLVLAAASLVFLGLAVRVFRRKQIAS